MEAARGKRLLRALVLAAIVVALAAIALAFVFAVPGIRAGLLREALRRTDDSVHGRLTVSRLAWPRLGRWELRALRWTNGADTLAACEGLDLQVNVRALLRRDVHVEELTVRGLRVDAPAIRALFPPEAGDGAKPAPPAPFPRVGSLPALPSCAVDRFDVEITRLRLATETPPSRGRASGTFDARAGRPPRLVLESVTAEHPAAGVLLGPGQLSIDLATGRFEGRVPGSWRDRPFTIAARPERDDGFRLTIGITPRLPGLPSDETLELRVTGDARVDPTPAARLHVSAGPFAGLDSLSMDVVAGPDRASVSDLRLSGEGLRLAGSWSMVRGHHDLAVDARVDGSDWIAPFVPAGSLPDSLALSVDLSAEGPADGLRGRALIAGNLRADAVAVDSLELSMHGAFTGSDPLAFTGAARAHELWLTGAGDLVGRDPVEVRLGPWRLGGERLEPLGSRGTRVRFYPRDERITVEDLRLAGWPGDVLLNGGWSRDTGGEADLRIAWPEPPAALVARLRAPPDSLAALAERWRRESGSGVRASGRLDPAGGWTADARMRLPGPSTLAPVLPPGPRWEELSAVRARVRASGDSTGFVARVDARDTAWLEDARLSLRGNHGTITLEEGIVRGLGLLVEASGVASAENVDARLALDLEGDAGLRLLASDLPEEITVGAAADVALLGPPGALAVRADASLQARGPTWHVPGLLVTAEMEGGALRRIRADGVDTLRVGSYRFHRWAAAIRPLAPATEESRPPLLAALELEGDELGWAQVASVESGDHWRAQTDTLTLRVKDRHLRTERPFLVRWSPSDSGLSVEGLRLRGDLGSIRGDGGVGPAEGDLRVEIDLERPPKLDAWSVPPGLWPDRMTGWVEIARRDSVRADVVAAGLELGPLREVDARLTAETGSAGLFAHLDIEDGDARPLRVDGHAPFLLDVLAARATDTGGDLDVTLTANRLPLPERIDGAALRSYLEGESGGDGPRLDGTGALRGRPEAPAGRFDARVTFPGWPRLRDHDVRLEATVDSSGTTGLAARLDWRRLGAPVASAQLEVPPPFSPLAPPSPETPVRLLVRMNDTDLEDFGAFLPRTLRVSGRLGCDLRIEGVPRTAQIAGWLEGRGIGISTARGDRARAEGRVEFTGSLDAPQVVGKFTVSQGRLLIPDPPRALHDARGEALLWRRPPSPASVAAPEAPPTTGGPTLEVVDLGIDLTIPGAFWIRGRGLDVEMAGDLSLVLAGGRPRLDGELRAVRGTLSLFANRFDLERGRAVFYGDEANDPDLDIVLSRRKGDVRVQVRVTGRSSEPRLELSSEPAMEESDILSHLFFGRSSSDLDREQTGFLETQATAALQSFAIPGLERELGWRLGLDVVRLRARDDKSGGLSIVVGKYLSPRALLKYDQSLERGSDAIVNLEYWLTRHVRLETITGRQSQSGIEMNWSRDY
jgi:hypothetical protein